MFDTHCHLNFKSFEGQADEVIKRAAEAGVGHIVVPGTDVISSEKAVEIAEKYDGIYAAVGIHPHHAIQYVTHRHLEQGERSSPDVASGRKHASLDFSVAELTLNKIEGLLRNDLEEIEKLLKNPKVVAVGEIGLDRHQYQKTKHENYRIDEEFINLQKELLIAQIKLAHKYKKALIFHNREAKNDLLKILTNHFPLITNHSVFHCCEPDFELLEFAKKYKMFIGVDGDVTYLPAGRQVGGKAEFIKQVPLEMLVLETDSPFLTPKIDIRRLHHNYNEPANLRIIAEFVAKLKNISVKKLIEATTLNAKRLFSIHPSSGSG